MYNLFYLCCKGGQTKRIQFVDTFSIKNLILRDQLYVQEAQTVLYLYDGTDPDAIDGLTETLHSISMIKSKYIYVM